MPHKFNAERRAKIPKQKYRVANCSDYNESLRQRADLTVWISEDALGLWSAPRRTTPGGQRRYLDMAIETCLTLGMVFHQPLRQTQGLLRNITAMLGVALAMPDFSTLSRRSAGRTLRTTRKTERSNPVHLVVDSTGLKIYGECEWLEEKHITKTVLHGSGCYLSGIGLTM
ncbi:MAG: transposase [Litoreibacter sp.]